MKTCNKCGADKELDEFNFINKEKTKRNSICKKCKSVYNKNHIKANKEMYSEKRRKNYENNKEKEKEYNLKYRKLNKENKKEYDKNYRENNKDIIKENQKIYYSENKEKIKKYFKGYYEENKNLLLEKQKIYVEENKEKIREYKKTYYENNKEYINKRINDYYHKYPYRYFFRSILRRTLQYNDISKCGRTIDILGYSADELKVHIENQFTIEMSWDNYGEWHIDHIKPISTFNKKTKPSIVNALSNLRPMWATTREINGIIYVGNLNKGNKID